MVNSAFNSVTKTAKAKISSFSIALVLAVMGMSGATPLFTQLASAASSVSVCASGCDYTTIQDGINNVDTGGTVNVQAGTYTGSNILVNKSVTLQGVPGTKVVVPNVTETNAFNVQAHNVTISGFEIEGPASTSYLTYAWGSINTRGIFVYNGYNGFNITNNTIHNLRNNILIDGRNNGSVTNNVIDNSKSGISVQYTDAGTGNTEGYTVAISGNSQGAFGNEWGLNMHLNGHYDSGLGTLVGNAVKIAPTAPNAVQTALLANKAANGGWAVQDQGYSFQNRTEVNVATTGSDSSQGSKLGPLATVQTGVNAVTKSGVVTVNAGTYSGNVIVPVNNLTLQAPSGATLNLGSGFGINLNNGPVITGFKMTGFTVNSSSGTTYALKAYKADGLTLENDTFNGSTGNGGGIDINSTSNVTLNNVTATGFKKNGFAVTAQFAGGDTPSSNIIFNGVTASNNNWAGIAFYTMNGSSTIGADITGVSFTGNNVVSGNAKGIEIVGDSDANAAAHNTPRWNVTNGSGGSIDLGTTAFSGNSVDIINYQTKGVQALSATFNGLTGDSMTASQRSSEDALIVDKLDYSNFGLVKYWTVVVTVNSLSTDDTTPALSGTVNDKDAAVNVTVNGHTYVANVSGTANGSGTYDWNVGVADALPVGTYDVSVAATDQGGNVANDATTNELTISAPASSGGGSGSGGSSSGSGSTNGNGGTTTTTGGGRGASFFALFGANANTAGQVLGAASDDSQNDSKKDNKGHVKSASINKDKNSDSEDSAFLGLGWWWLPIIVALLALLYFLYRRFRPGEKA